MDLEFFALRLASVSHPARVRRALTVMVLVTLLFAAPGAAEVESEGPNSPAAVVNDASFGTASWTLPGNAAASDNVYAQAAPGGTPTQYLKATDFGFSLPAVAAVKGVLVQVEKRSLGASVFDARVRIVKNGVVGSAERADGAAWPVSDTVVDYGGETDLWGETWTVADINAADFGVAISATDAFDTAGVDHITITVFWAFCPDTPRGTCRTATKSVLLVNDKTPDTKDKMVWKWIKGEPTSQTEFGVPTTTAQYSLCLYAGTTAPTLVTQIDVPPDSTKWKPISTKGYKYKDKPGMAGGIQKIVLKGSIENKSKIIVKGKGGNLPTLAPAFDLPVSVELLNTETEICWGSDFPTATKNETGKFKAKTP
jgi:hypothetical protein